MPDATPPASAPRRHRRRLLCGALALLGASAALQAGAGGRIVSINLCTDQLLLLLAPRSRIASVSHLAANPLYSAYADRADGLPVNHARIEEIVAQDPSLILAYQYSDGQLVRLLRQLGYRVEVIPAPDTLEDVAAAIATAARVLDEAHAGARIVAQMQEHLQSMAGSAPRRRPLAVIYAPDGYSPGAASLSGAILAAAGFRNLSAELGNAHGANLPLEQLLRAQPDLIIIDDDEADKHSLAQRKLTHPALRQGLPAATTVRLSGRYWSCPTPKVVDAVADLRAYR